MRRAARECTDLASLYARLADQIADPAAREAFLAHALRSGVGPGTFGSSGARAETLPGGRGTATTGGVAVRSAVVSDATLVQAEKLLAQHVGPIARVIVKKAAAKNRERDALFAALLDAVPDNLRARLREALTALG